MKRPCLGKLVLLCVFAPVLCQRAQAAPVFTNINAGLPGVYAGSAVWGDYDNDGRLDILVTGWSTSERIGQVWRNTGGRFTNINAGLPGVGFSSVAWGDYDNDGRLDVLLTGNAAGTDLAQVWRNTGGGFGLGIDLSQYYGVESGSIAWGDYDDDGRLDILLTGYGPTSPYRTPDPGDCLAQLLRNTGSGFVQTPLLGEEVNYSSVAWGDYDNDGRLDFILAGTTLGIGTVPYDYYSHGIFRVGKSLGNGNWDVSSSLVSSPVSYCSLALGDYDNDGRLDILLTGLNTSGNPITQVWHNTGNSFSNINAGLPGVSQGAVAWGDYDNDGKLDILLTGTTNGAGTGAISQVWRNTGVGFTNINAGLPGVVNGSVAWGDFDNDGRLDILLTGTTNGSVTGAISQVWRNLTPATNSTPTVPSGLHVTVSNLIATLTWNAASDLETPAAALTYNVRIGTAPGGSEIRSAMSNSNGFRCLPQPGNVQHRLTFNFNVTVGTPYYCSVQTVDGVFAGSPFAPELNFKLLQTPPVLVSAATTNLIPGDVNADGVVDQSELNTVLSNYWPYSPWLYLTNIAGLGGTNVTFALTNSTAGAFSVEYTTNLADWYFLGPAMPRYLFTDTNAPAVPQRYYRLRWP